VVLGITFVFMLVEAVAGWYTNSLALLSDAGHMLTDVGALGLALFALWFSRRSAPAGLTFGYLRFEILAALINGIALLGITGFIFFEAWQRIAAPPEVRSSQMLVVAILGLTVNVVSFWVLSRGGGHSLNERGALLHILGDMLGSVGAIIAALVMSATGWYLADPIVSAVIGLLILRSTGELLRETVNILMEGTPIHLSFEEVHGAMMSVPGVEEVKDLHLWSIASGFDALSAHVVVPSVEQSDAIRIELRRLLNEQFQIIHTTLEIERPGDTPACPPGLEGRCGGWSAARRA
jgi:cobalt-zinc-cadmium efflux system protein